MLPFPMQYHTSTNTLTIHIDHDCTSDEVFASYFLSRKQRYAYYQRRAVRKNDQIITQNALLTTGEMLCINCQEPFSRIPSWNRPLKICYEDELCLIVDKPVSVIVHSDGVNTMHTLNNMVQQYYIDQGLELPVRPIHRLDQETSGLVFYCKIPFLQPLLDHMLLEKRIERIYLAWVKGCLKQKTIIEQPIARDRHHAKKMRIATQGAYAYTTAIPRKTTQNATLVECHLRTGRTHQIRVHLAHCHHPILSDPLYGTKDSRIQRCALHAWKLCFEHPFKQTMVQVCCELPDDMKF